MKNKRKSSSFSSQFLLFLILVFALFLRVYKISAVPPALNWDEISHGYNAYSILKTGKDQWGFTLPWIFRVYGDYKLPLYIYLTIPSVLVFGLNAFSVRLISILSGVGLVWAAYLITKKITRNETFSLLSSLLAAVTPWGLFLSRIAVEANLGAFLFAMGIYFLICWVDNQKLKFLTLTAFFLGLSLHAYNSARILVPIILLLAAFLIFRKKKIKESIAPALILLIFFIPVAFQLFDKTANARFDLVSLIDQGTVNQIIEKRVASKLPKIISSILYNRPTFFIYSSLKNYLASLSPKYLFLQGGSHYQFSLPGHELLYLITAPFLILGIIKVILRGKEEEKILLFWFLIGIIPSAITKDAPHVLRTAFILPSPLILTVLGAKLTVEFLRIRSGLKGNLLTGALIILVLISFQRWWHDYLSFYPKNYSWSWQYGYRQVVDFIRQSYSQYNEIYLTKQYGEPHEFILFYFPWDPLSYQNDKSKIWDYHSDWYWVDAFDKFKFINDWEIKQVLRLESCKVGKCLLITSPGNYPEGWGKIKTISFLDGKPVFDILEK